MTDQQLPNEPPHLQNPCDVVSQEEREAILRRIQADFSSSPGEIQPPEEAPAIPPPEKSPLGQRIIKQFLESLRFREDPQFRERLEDEYKSSLSQNDNDH